MAQGWGVASYYSSSAQTFALRAVFVNLFFLYIAYVDGETSHKYSLTLSLSRRCLAVNTVLNKRAHNYS